MNERKNFRVSVGGYHKRDVMTYIEKLTADAKAAEQRYQSLLSSVRQENTRLISRIGELETRVATLEQRLAEERRRALELEQQANTLMGDLSRCKTAFEQNRERAKRLSRAFENSTRENQALRESLMYAERENERLEQMRRRLAAILLEPDATGYTAPLSVVRGHLPSQDEDRTIGFGESDIEEMNQDLDELGQSIANRLADIDGFINATKAVAVPKDTDEETVHPAEGRIYPYPGVVMHEQEDAPMHEPEPNSIREAGSVDISELDSQGVREAARKGFTPVPRPNESEIDRQRSHTPSTVEKRWQRLGFVVRRGRDDEDYVEENRSSNPLFSAPIWSDDGANQG